MFRLLRTFSSQSSEIQKLRQDFEFFINQPQPDIAQVQSAYIKLLKHYKEQNDYQQILQDTQKFLDLQQNPNHQIDNYTILLTQGQLAASLNACGQFQQALEMYQQQYQLLKTIYPHSDDYIINNIANQAGCMFKLQKYQEFLDTIESIQSYLEQKQELATIILFQKTSAYLNLNDTKNYIKCGIEAARRYQNQQQIPQETFASMIDSLAQLLVAEGKIEQAAEVVQLGIDKISDELQVQKANLHGWYGICLGRLGKEQEMIENLKQAESLLQQNGQTTSPLYKIITEQLGSHLYRQRQTKEASYYLEQTLNWKVDNNEFLESQLISLMDAYFQCCQAQKQLPQASENLKKWMPFVDQVISSNILSEKDLTLSYVLIARWHYEIVFDYSVVKENLIKVLQRDIPSNIQEWVFKLITHFNNALVQLQKYDYIKQVLVAANQYKDKHKSIALEDIDDFFLQQVRILVLQNQNEHVLSLLLWATSQEDFAQKQPLKQVQYLDQLAIQYTNRQNLTEAIQTLIKSFECAQKVYNGQESTDLVNRRVSIADLYQKQGNVQKEIEWIQQAVQALQSLNKDVLKLIDLCTRLGNCYKQQNEAGQARKYLELALQHASDVNLKESLQKQLDNLGSQ